MNIKIPQAKTLPAINTQRRKIPFDQLVQSLSYSPAADVVSKTGNVLSEVLQRRGQLKKDLVLRRQFEKMAGLETGVLGSDKSALPLDTSYNLLKLKQQRDLEERKLALKEKFNNIYRNFLILKESRSKDSTDQMMKLRGQLVNQVANTLDQEEMQTLQYSIGAIDSELSNRNVLPRIKSPLSNPNPKTRPPLSSFDR